MGRKRRPDTVVDGNPKPSKELVSLFRVKDDTVETSALPEPVGPVSSVSSDDSQVVVCGWGENEKLTHSEATDASPSGQGSGTSGSLASSSGAPDPDPEAFNEHLQRIRARLQSVVRGVRDVAQSLDEPQSLIANVRHQLQSRSEGTLRASASSDATGAEASHGDAPEPSGSDGGSAAAARLLGRFADGLRSGPGRRSVREQVAAVEASSRTAEAALLSAGSRSLGRHSMGPGSGSPGLERRSADVPHLLRASSGTYSRTWGGSRGNGCISPFQRRQGPSGAVAATRIGDGSSQRLASHDLAADCAGGATGGSGPELARISSGGFDMSPRYTPAAAVAPCIATASEALGDGDASLAAAAVNAASAMAYLEAHPEMLRELWTLRARVRVQEDELAEMVKQLSSRNAQLESAQAAVAAKERELSAITQRLTGVLARLQGFQAQHHQQQQELAALQQQRQEQREQREREREREMEEERAERQQQSRDGEPQDLATRDPELSGVAGPSTPPSPRPASAVVAHAIAISDELVDVDATSLCCFSTAVDAEHSPCDRTSTAAGVAGHVSGPLAMAREEDRPADAPSEPSEPTSQALSSRAAAALPLDASSSPAAEVLASPATEREAGEGWGTEQAQGHEQLAAPESPERQQQETREQAVQVHAEELPQGEQAQADEATTDASWSPASAPSSAVSESVACLDIGSPDASAIGRRELWPVHTASADPESSGLAHSARNPHHWRHSHQQMQERIRRRSGWAALLQLAPSLACAALLLRDRAVRQGLGGLCRRAAGAAFGWQFARRAGSAATPVAAAAAVAAAAPVRRRTTGTTAAVAAGSKAGAVPPAKGNAAASDSAISRECKAKWCKIIRPPPSSAIYY